MSYYARFETIEGHLFRFDTRIYLGDIKPSNKDICIGAIIGKNPGSAQPLKLNVLAPLQLGKDQMLKSVRNRFLSGFANSNKKTPEHAYIQVWNLFYLCNPNLTEACSTINKIANPPNCQTEENYKNISWFAWGGNNKKLNPFKERFLTRSHKNCFFYDKNTGKIIRRAPSIQDFAKHTQGMPSNPVINYLANVL